MSAILKIMQAVRNHRYPFDQISSGYSLIGDELVRLKRVYFSKASR